MKILHINLVYWPAHRYGGPIKSVHNLNKWLVKKGADVTVYTTNIDGRGILDVPTDRPVMIDGVKVNYFPISFPRAWFYSSAFRRALKENIHSFDIIHITSVFTAASTLGACYALKNGRPYIISPRGSLMKTPIAGKGSLKKKIYISLIEKRNLRNAAAIHFALETEREDYLDQGFPLKKGFVLPNGLDPDEFPQGVEKGLFRQKFKIPKNGKIVLFLGRIDWIKGLDVLVPAFAAVSEKYPEAVLVLAGGNDSGYEKEVLRLIEEHRLREKVVFTGMIVGDEKARLLSDSDVFVMPSQSESFGMSAVEAMCYRLPVVVTDGVGLAPAVKKSGAGLVVRKEPAEISAAILEILADPVRAKKMGEAGARIVDSEFSMPAIAEHFMEAYNEVIESF
jgi:glycosyltransferase involved in cell wall biosynthesis